ncbi:MAG: hypothetical protein ABIO70_20290 [Pseudomonadota bacterium]
MGLALDEPSLDDTRTEEAGIPFLIPSEISSWMNEGIDLHVDYNRYWGSFSVRLGGYHGGC